MTTNALRIGQGKTLVAICSAKPYWARLITVWVTIWGNPHNVCLREPGWCISHLPPLQLYLGWVSVYLILTQGSFSCFPLKIDPQLKYIWLWCCAPRSYMAGIAAATGTPYMLLVSLSCPFHNSAPWLLWRVNRKISKIVFSFLFPLDFQNGSRKTSCRLSRTREREWTVRRLTKIYCESPEVGGGEEHGRISIPEVEKQVPSLFTFQDEKFAFQAFFNHL